MAEGNSDDGSWWGGWIQSAKEKSQAAVDFVKKDLVEFGQVTIEDTEVLVKEKLTQENAKVAGSRVKEGFTKVLGGISKALVIEPDDAGQAIKVVVPDHQVYSRAKARLHAIQVDPDTYCIDPDGQRAQYQEWKETFVLDANKGTISELLVTKTEIRSLYTQLVPSTVSHKDFWHRYFYKVQQFEKDEARKKELVKRADDVETDLGWDDEDDWADLADGSPEHSPTRINHREHSPLELGGVGTVTNTHSVKENEGMNIDEITKVKVAVPLNMDESDSVDLIVPSSSENSEHIGPKIDKSDIENEPEKIPEITSAKQSVDTKSILKIDTENKAEISELVQCSSKTNDVPNKSEPTDNIKPVGASQGENAKGDITVEVNKDNIKDVQTTADLPVEPPSERVEEVDKKRPIEEPLTVAVDQLKMKDKGDMIVVTDGETPLSDGSNGTSSSSNKESSSVDEDWEKDFDIELTEEELKLASEAAKKMSLGKMEDVADEEEDDWESWD
ncbi:unnamed protein product [Owenia fusiformis]|uniref:BSD domain-containing protein n=1 Tax=Owenia fusiformis TaxID=6347 RepID=A0A8S4N260_OWEFU|nr:unnamed protein product [Owenia fusiformis]